jgi:hypothetical protein
MSRLATSMESHYSGICCLPQHKANGIATKATHTQTRRIKCFVRLGCILQRSYFGHCIGFPSFGLQGDREAFIHVESLLGKGQGLSQVERELFCMAQNCSKMCANDSAIDL